jgi:hypothetical protein
MEPLKIPNKNQNKIITIYIPMKTFLKLNNKKSIISKLLDSFYKQIMKLNFQKKKSAINFNKK